jgi:hypothetical protein
MKYRCFWGHLFTAHTFGTNRISGRSGKFIFGVLPELAPQRKKVSKNLQLAVWCRSNGHGSCEYSKSMRGSIRA